MTTTTTTMMMINKGAITSKLKHAIKLKISPARLAQLLQPSLAFCSRLQPMTAQSCRTCFSFIACFILLVSCDHSLRRQEEEEEATALLHL